jgi:membrane protein DedA with SNARE-associated domain
VQQFIASYGYLAIFVLMMAESACIPVPSEVTMVFGGALAAGAVAGAHLNLPLVIAVGVAGNVAGSYIAWGVGAYGGRAAWRRWGRYVLLRPGDIDRADRWFGRHGTKAVFFGRLLPVVRTFISLPAGIARMSPVRFGVYTLAGCIPWTAALAWAGYAVGANWQHVANDFHGATYALAAVIILLVVIAVGLLVRRRVRGRGEDRGAASGQHRHPASGRRRDLASGHEGR